MPGRPARHQSRCHHLKTNRQSDFGNRQIRYGKHFCIFQRLYADLLEIEVEKGERESIRTAKGSFTAFGHEIVIQFSNLEWEAMVYFAQDESFPVSVLGRNGFLNKINISYY